MDRAVLSTSSKRARIRPSTRSPDASPPAGRGRATAGPVCPVERVPPDPGCSPRPVVGAVVVVRDASGREVVRVRTGDDGTYFAPTPAGEYTVVAEPAAGIMHAPGPQTVTVTSGVAVIDLDYDTGIR